MWLFYSHLCVAEGDDPSLTEHISYAEALKRTSVIANMLTSNGVKRGDVVTLYMPMTPTVIFTMLACARIGAVHSVIFAGFSDDAIADRIASAGSKFVVTADGGVRGGRNIPLKKTIDSALGKDRAKAVVEKLFVFQRTMEDVPLDATRDILVTQDYLGEDTTKQTHTLGTITHSFTPPSALGTLRRTA